MKTAEGIILRTSTFADNAHILTVLCKSFGIITLVEKGYKQKSARSYCALLKIEAQFRPSTKELWKCAELHVLSSYPALRLNLEKLQLASYFVTLLQQFLPKYAAADELYSLIDLHLQYFSHDYPPKVVAGSFLLKFLDKEGLLPNKMSKEALLLLKSFPEDFIHLECTDELLNKITTFFGGYNWTGSKS